MAVALLDVYSVPNYEHMLWVLLEERDPVANISHKTMPTWEDHIRFIANQPYADWWFIVDKGLMDKPPNLSIYGTCYISRQREIGIQVLKRYQRCGHASEALAILIAMHSGQRLLANVNPNNDRSIALFRRYGFQVCQYTFEREPS